MKWKDGELLEKSEELGRRAVACQHWHWRIGMAALAANDKARLFLPGCDLPIRGEDGVRLISHIYSEARYSFSDSHAVRRAHEKAYVTMLTESDDEVDYTDNEDNVTRLYAVGFTHLENLFPDFHDTVTARGLLQVVRAVWGAGFHLVPDGGWLARGARLPDGATVNLGVCAPTEVEALVAALEAASGVAP